MSYSGWSLVLPDEASVDDLALLFSQHLQTPFVFYLRGELGVGKTTFARALIQALGYKGRVKSPSYGLLEPYTAGQFNILHLDLYRVEDPGELDFLAIRDLFDNKSILLVEWPEKGGSFLAPCDLDLHFSDAQEMHYLKIQPFTNSGQVLADVVLAKSDGATSSSDSCNMQFLD